MASIKTIGIAAGAGLASALLFAASAKGGAPALFIAYLTPLPIMIAALGFGQATGLLAAGIAGCVVAALLGFVAGGFFGLMIGFPSWWVGYLSLLARPAAAVSPSPSPAPLLWYPLGRLVALSAALIAAVVLAFGAATLLHYGGYASALSTLSARLKSILAETSAELPVAMSEGDVIRLLPALMAGSTFLMLMVNLWIAGRVVQGSSLLTRPWPALPENLRLPRVAAFTLIAASLAVLLGGLPGVISGVVIAPLCVAFVLQGLGAAHALTRSLTARRLILFGLYFVTFRLPLLLLAVAVLGVVDCLLPLRGTQPPKPSPTTS